MVATIMRYILIMLTVVVAEQAFSWSLWSVERLDMEYYKYRPGYRQSYMLEGEDSDGRALPMQFQDGAALHMDLNIVEYLYWRNHFHMAQDTHQHVRHVGWEWEAGINVSRLTGRRFPVEIYEHHHSQHGLEYINPRGDRFPVEDTYGVRLLFIDNRRGGN